MIQLFILYLAITECIQVFIANKKIIKWILPILNFIISIFVEINLIIFTMLNEGKNFFQTIDKEVILLFLILNIPTIIYIITNIVTKKRKKIKKNRKIYYNKNIYLTYNKNDVIITLA